MNHSFNIDVATQYGVNCAIMLENIAYWVNYNRANNLHLHDGKYWTYNSREGWAILYPYYSADQIKRTLDKLRENELIETGNYNEVPYDRTLWYTITDKGIQALGKNEVFDWAKSPNGLGENAQPIPSTLPLTNNTLKSIKPDSAKHKYGEYQHVLLTDDQYNRLVDEFGAEKAIEYIMKVDEYCQMHGKTYKDYNPTVRKFIRTDSSKGKGNSLTSSAPDDFDRVWGKYV